MPKSSPAGVIPEAMGVTAPNCPYCEATSELVGGKVIYPHRPDLFEKKFWRCATCTDVYVGCHKKTKEPLGRLADAELRKAKIRAHSVFDPLWRDNSMTRKQAYSWLSKAMQIPAEKCHIGMFDIEQCTQVVAEVEKYLDNYRDDDLDDEELMELLG